MGINDLGGILFVSNKLIKEEIGDVSVSFYLRKEEQFELNISEQRTEDVAGEQLENCFNSEVIENVCNANKKCNVDELVSMGLQCNPIILKETWAQTLPLEQMGASVGFILIYSSIARKLSEEQINLITSITPGLSKAIVCSQAILHV